MKVRSEEMMKVNPDEKGISFPLTPERLMRRCKCGKRVMEITESTFLNVPSAGPQSSPQLGEGLEGNSLADITKAPPALHYLNLVLLKSLSPSAMVLLLSPTGKSRQVWKADILLMGKKRLYVLRSQSHPKNLNMVLWYSGLLKKAE